MADEPKDELDDSKGQVEGDEETQDEGDEEEVTTFTQEDVDKIIAGEVGKVTDKLTNDKNVEVGRRDKAIKQRDEARSRAETLELEVDKLLLQGVDEKEKEKWGNIVELRKGTRSLRAENENLKDENEDLKAQISQLHTERESSTLKGLAAQYSNIDIADLKGKTLEQAEAFCKKYGVRVGKEQTPVNRASKPDSAQSRGKKTDWAKAKTADLVAEGLKGDKKPRARRK